jgi:hypothetical protein
VPAVLKKHVSKVARGGWNLFAKILHEYLGIAVVEGKAVSGRS